MAIETICQTPDVKFRGIISPEVICVVMDLPMKLELSEEEAKLLEANLHNALELVLARYF